MTGGQNWDREKLFFDGDSYFAALLASLREARSSISLETYIFECDPIGESIEAALAEAAARGVRTRLLVDGIGARTWIERRSLGLAKSGVEVRVYHPVRFSKWLGFSRLNRRNHRKQCVIDERRAFVGSINVSAVHARKHSHAFAWRDTAAELEGSGAGDLLNGFDRAWARSHTLDGHRHWMEALQAPAVRKPVSLLVRLNHTAKLRRHYFRDFLSRLRNARERIWITNAYLAPSHPVIRRLKKAAASGVDVRLLVPQGSDVFFMPWVARAHYTPLRDSGVRIFEYLPRFLHAKSVIIDDWTALGSSNLNRRSLFHDLEVDVVLASTESLRLLERQFETDLAQAEEIAVPPRHWQARLGRLILYFFRRWI